MQLCIIVRRHQKLTSKVGYFTVQSEILSNANLPQDQPKSHILLTVGLIYNDFGHQYHFMIFSPMTVKFIRELCKMNLYSKHSAAPSFGFLNQEYS